MYLQTDIVVVVGDDVYKPVSILVPLGLAHLDQKMKKDLNVMKSSPPESSPG